MDAYAKSKTPKEARDKRATPPDVFARFQDVLGMQFVHDVCAEPQTAKCASFWTEEEDAFSKNWMDAYLDAGILDPTALWMNPPYSNVAPWCKKASEEAKNGAFIVGLLPDDRSTDWYQEYIDNVAATVFIPNKRISFHNAAGVPQPGNPKGSVFALWVPWQVTRTSEERFTL